MGFAMNSSITLNQSAQRKRASASEDQSWLHRFWLLLGAFALICAAAIYFYMDSQASEVDEEVYVSVKVTTTIGFDQLVVCKLSLLVDPEQEKGLQKRQKMLEAVVSSSLSDSYQQEKTPKLAEVRDALYVAINRKLPRKLQVQDVLIQELLVGIS
jgi:hypothetical protein